MRNPTSRLFVFFWVLACPAMAEEFPPIGNRYDVISDDARAVVKSLKKLEARTNVGVNFLDYDRGVSEVFPDVKLFLESPEARNQPELQFVLGNAMDCYLEVRSLWAQKISSDDPIEKYNASITLITAQPMLWKVAGANISGATALIESPKADLQKVQESIARNADSLTVDGALLAAEQQDQILWREARAKASGCPVPDAVAADNAHDLASLAFQPGDYGDDISAGEMKSRLPQMYEAVPPASQEGRMPVMRGADQAGSVTILVYQDAEVAKKAYEAIAKGFGAKRQRLARVGDTAEGTEQSAVFRRNAVVVHTHVSGLSANAHMDGLRRVDKRVAKLSGDEARRPVAAGDDAAVPVVAKEQAGDANLAKATANGSFDIRALSELAKEMAKEGGEKALYGKIIVSIAASKKWVRKGTEEDEPFEGTVVEITPDGAAVFETAKGRITLRAQELSGDSGARIVRLKDVCRKLAALNN